MYDAFYPGQVWLDTNGNRIQAHGGSLIYLDGVYYWYGENKEKTDKAAGIWHWGVRYYASTDLYNWEDRGLLIPPVTDDPNSSLHPTSMMDRPHILYNARTKKYVCWLKIMEKDQTQTETVLTADSFFGPYTIVREKLRPLGMSAGDFDLAVAPDGKAYYFFERVHSETIIADLTEDYTDVTGYYSTHFPHKGPPHVREATAHFIRNGKHYLLTSGTTGYFPNPSEAAMADGTPYQTTDEDEWMRDDPERKKSDWMHYASIFRSAVNNLPDNEKGQAYPETYIRMDEDATKNLYPYLDIAGYNYYEDRYEVLHKLHPERVLLGTETRHTMLPDTMKFAKTHPYLIGDFVWTLQSHLGEINCCDLHYEENEEHKSYPWVTNHGGVLDLTGQAEPSLHRYEFIWGDFLDKPVHALYLASQPPVHNGKPPIATSYRWTDTVDGWTYEGYEGKRTFVDAYTDADSVEIFVNGKSAGKAQVKDYFAKIPCIYEPGELVGVGYDADGQEIYRTSVRTADAETVLTVKTDKNILRAGGQDFCFADVYITDKNGTVKLLPDYDVKIEVDGAASLQGYGSAAYKNADHYDQHHHKSWQGHLQAVLRSTEKTGPVTVTFTADGCAPAILHLSAE